MKKYRIECKNCSNDINLNESSMRVGVIFRCLNCETKYTITNASDDNYICKEIPIEKYKFVNDLIENSKEKEKEREQMR